MKPLYWGVFAGLCALCFSVDASGAVNQYTESFTTTTYKDTVHTTADWNTGAGVLRLFPFAPVLVGSYDTPGIARGLTVAGDLAFVADYSTGLQVIDISTPASPTLAGTYDTPGTALGVAVAGDLAFVADYTAGLQIIDITNPASPTLVGTYDTPGNAYDVAVAGDLAFVADWTAGLQIIDIASPASPALVGTYDTPGNAIGVAAAGDLAFVADYLAGLQVIDVTTPASPTLVGTYDTPAYAWDVAVAGDLAFVADHSAGLQIIDITNPASPALVGTYNTPGYAYHVMTAGDLAFVADDVAGLQIIDITNPASPALADSYDTTGIARGVAVAGELALVADDASGLQIINVSQLLPSPILVGAYDTAGSAGGVAVAGDLAFVADGSSGFQIIDISTTASPTLVGSYDAPQFVNGVTVVGDLAFVAESVGGLQILDISDPANPVPVGSYDTPGGAYGVAVAGDLAFVADYGAGLQIVDIGNPASPTLVGSYNTPGNAYGVAAAGDLALVADGPTGLQIIDIGNPASPTLAGSYNTLGNANGVVVAGDLAFVADGAAGLQMIDISDPASPTLVVSYNTPGTAYGVAVAGDLALVGDGSYGLQLVRVFQREVYAGQNIGRSLAIDGGASVIVRTRLSSTETAGISWEVSVNNGLSWQAITPDSTWVTFLASGTDLQWRTTHTWLPGINPTVSDLLLEWIYDHAVIDAITDIPNDQGRWVRVSFSRSGRDFADEASLPITNYGIWRRVEGGVALSAQESLSQESSQVDPGIMKIFGGLPLFASGHRVFVGSRASEPLAAGFPPGTWELVQNVPALQEDVYLTAIPTTADSTQAGTSYTVLVITAHTTTPSVWYASAPDSGYSVDNLAPSVPASFAVAYHTGSGNTLTWDESPDADFQYFRVYRSSDPDFTPSPATMVHAATSPGWVDPDYDGGGVHYKVTATDFSGNESDAATAGTITAVGDAPMPRTFALYPNVPNPFNPTTRIRYDVPEGAGDVTLRVYDVSGRMVRTLVDGVQGAGAKSVSWDGRDDGGRPVATGVYFYRMRAGRFVETRKMVLLK